MGLDTRTRTEQARIGSRSGERPCGGWWDARGADAAQERAVRRSVVASTDGAWRGRGGVVVGSRPGGGVHGCWVAGGWQHPPASGQRCGDRRTVGRPGGEVNDVSGRGWRDNDEDTSTARAGRASGQIYSAVAAPRVPSAVGDGTDETDSRPTGAALNCLDAARQRRPRNLICPCRDNGRISPHLRIRRCTQF